MECLKCPYCHEHLKSNKHTYASLENLFCQFEKNGKAFIECIECKCSPRAISMTGPVDLIFEVTFNIKASAYRYEPKRTDSI